MILFFFGSVWFFFLHNVQSSFSFKQDLFPYKEWWVVPAKVAFDQTAWSAIWNSIYYTVVALLRLDPPISILNELKATFFPMLTVREHLAFHICFIEIYLFGLLYLKWMLLFETLRLSYIFLHRQVGSCGHLHIS